MMVVGEKNPELVANRVLKKEVMEFERRNQAPYDHHDLQNAVTVAFYGHEQELDENVTLAQMSRKSPLNMDKQNKVVENKHKLLNSHSKQVVSGEAQKFASKAAIDGTSCRGEAQSSAVIRAEEVQSRLDPEFPSFVKSLVRSHVASCFWMGLPVAFCKKHLPDKDTTITLEDESGKEYKLKYIAYKTGLSAGWRQFSAVHKLLEGDALVFQLVEPTKFKVYIIRAKDLRELDGALSLLHLESYAKQRVADRENADTNAVAYNSSKRKHGKSVPIDFQKKKKTSMPRMVPKARHSTEQSENDSEEALSEVLESFKMLEFKDVKGFENFSIIVDGMPIDTEIPFEVRSKYYRLCCSQHAFLHHNLIKGMNYQLIVGIISETVNIADAIKISTISTPRVEFAIWDKTLLAFEHLGMSVEFLRARLRRLVSIAYETDGASETRRYLAYRPEHSQADDEIKNIETKLEELKGACNDFGAYLESLKRKAEGYQLKFQKEVAAPW